MFLSGLSEGILPSLCCYLEGLNGLGKPRSRRFRTFPATPLFEFYAQVWNFHSLLGNPVEVVPLGQKNGPHTWDRTVPYARKSQLGLIWPDEETMGL